ncbi:MAG: hypothetical protein ACOCYE_00800 [Pseudomonadota bacterium]
MAGESGEEQAGERVRDARRLLAEAITDAADGLAIVDAQLDLVVANGAFAGLTGWPAEQLEGVSLETVLGLGVAPLRHGAREVADLEVVPRDPARRAGPLCALRASDVRLSGGQPGWLVRLTERPPSAPVEAPPPATSPLDSGKAQTALARLAELAHRQGVRVGGAQVRLIGLHRARDLIGADWPRFRGRVALLSESIIAHDLTPDDVFTATGDGDYLVCFACSDQTEADRRARRLQTRLENRLLGTDAVTNWLPPSDRPALRALGVEVAATILSSDPSSGAWPTLEDVTRRVRGHAHRRRDELEHLLQRLAADRAIRFAPVRTRDGRETTMVRARWPGPLADRLLDLARGGQREDDTVLLLDGHRLDLLVAAYERGVLDRRAVLLDLQFQSLDRQRTRTRLLPLLRPITDVGQHWLVANLVGVPGQIHPSRLHDALTALKPFSRSQALSLAPRDLAALAPDAVPCRLFVLDAETARSIAGTAIAARLGARLRKARARLLLDGSTEVALAAAIGADLLADPG